MNIVIVNHYAGSPTLGMEFRPYYLAREWSKMGHRSLIVGASFSHLRRKQPFLNSKLVNQNVDGVDYLWLRVNQYRGNGPGRVMSMLLFTLKLFMFLPSVLVKFKPDLIIASSTYPLDNWPVYFLSRRFGARHCYEVHDLWPLSPMELGGYSRFHPFILLMQWAENYAYSKADLVVSMLPNTLEHMTNHGLDASKFIYVPNGVSIDDWVSNPIPELHRKVLEELKKSQNLIVGYVGGHAISNALRYLMEAALIAQGRIDKVKFVLVGDGSEKEGLIGLSKELGLTNVQFLPPVPKQCIPSLLDKMDILFLGWHRNPLYRFGISPNKLIDYMMAAKPVVHSVEAGNDIVKEAGCGISVEPENPEAIVQAIDKIAKLDDEMRSQMGRNARDFVIKNFDYQKLAQEFITFAASKEMK